MSKKKLDLHLLGIRQTITFRKLLTLYRIRMQGAFWRQTSFLQRRSRRKMDNWKWAWSPIVKRTSPPTFSHLKKGRLSICRGVGSFLHELRLVFQTTCDPSSSCQHYIKRLTSRLRWNTHWRKIRPRIDHWLTMIELFRRKWRMGSKRQESRHNHR